MHIHSQATVTHGLTDLSRLNFDPILTPRVCVCVSDAQSVPAGKPPRCGAPPATAARGGPPAGGASALAVGGVCQPVEAESGQPRGPGVQVGGA